jgi:hypothetical protein
MNRGDNMRKMVRIENGEIVEYGLPTTGELKNGSSVSGYHLQDIEILLAEGWLPLEDNPPEFNSDTHYLAHDGYEILADKVVVRYRLEEMPKHKEPEPSELEILGQEITMLKLSNISKDNTINTLGQELTNIKLQLLQGGM